MLCSFLSTLVVEDFLFHVESREKCCDLNPTDLVLIATSYSRQGYVEVGKNTPTDK